MKEGKGREVGRPDDDRADEGLQVGVVLKEIDKREDMIAGLEIDSGLQHHTATARNELATCERKAA